jgi:uncharacterized protein YkwD
MLRPFLFVFALASALFAQSLFAQTTSGSGNGDEASGSTASQQPTPKLIPAASPTRREDPAAESELLAMANQSRRQAGVPPLRMNDDLMKAARSHARLMIDQRQLSHQFEGEASLLKRLHETGVPLNSVAENVAYNYGATQVFDSFMHSPPHRANLLDPDFNAAAFVAIWSDGKLYVVQDFIRQTAEIVPASRQK